MSDTYKSRSVNMSHYLAVAKERAFMQAIVAADLPEFKRFLDGPDCDPNEILEDMLRQSRIAERLVLRGTGQFFLNKLLMVLNHKDCRVENRKQSLFSCNSVSLDKALVRTLFIKRPTEDICYLTCNQGIPLQSYHEVVVKAFLLHEQARVTSERASLRAFLQKGSGADISEDVIECQLYPWINQTLVTQENINGYEREWHRPMRALRASRMLTILKNFLTDYDDVSKFTFPKL